MASWLINWPGALGFYLQPIILLHYDSFTLEFVVLSFCLVDTTVVATICYNYSTLSWATCFLFHNARGHEAPEGE